MRILRRVLIGLVIFIVASVVIAFGYDRFASPRVVADYPAPGEMIDVNGLDTHTLCSGTGNTTIVLFHGFAGGAIDMLPLMDALENDVRVCAFDRPGADYSGSLPDDWTVDDAIAWNSAVIAEITNEGDSVYIAGHSLGGAYALAYVAQYDVDGVILLDGLTPDVADDVVRRMGTYGSLSIFAEVGLLRPVAGMFVSSEYNSDLRGQMTALRSRSQTIVGFADEGVMVADGLTTERLNTVVANLDVPMLLLIADTTDVPEGEAFTSSLLALDNTYPQSYSVMIEDAGHYLIASHADTLADNIITWIDAN